MTATCKAHPDTLLLPSTPSTKFDTIGLHMQLLKCSMYGHDTATAEEVAQELGISHSKAGMMACGMPLGTPAFITPFLAAQTEWMCSLIDALLALPLAT
jgi:hypothetical protein